MTVAAGTGAFDDGLVDIDVAFSKNHTQFKTSVNNLP